MTREIKFRAWDGVQQCWHYCFLERGGVRLKYEKNTPNQSNLSDWQQFTGLHDKNGKEAWEGDIVKRVYGFTKAGKPKEHIDQIVYRDDWAAFAFTSRTNIGVGWERLYSGHKALPWEIIGNIYEHSHLLNQ
jgi:uncharacterized phage protein (TIGR01671 family)